MKTWKLAPLRLACGAQRKIKSIKMWICPFGEGHEHATSILKLER